MTMPNVDSLLHYVWSPRCDRRLRKAFRAARCRQELQLELMELSQELGCPIADVLERATHLGMFCRVPLPAMPNPLRAPTTKVPKLTQKEQAHAAAGPADRLHAGKARRPDKGSVLGGQPDAMHGLPAERLRHSGGVRDPHAPHTRYMAVLLRPADAAAGDGVRYAGGLRLSERAAGRELAAGLPLDPPAAGTRCFPCWLAGHFCPARTWWYEVAVCHECLAAKPCAQKRMVLRTRESHLFYAEAS